MADSPVCKNKGSPTPQHYQQQQHHPPTTFSSLGLDKWLLSSLTALSIRTPTPIQSACIPPILHGHDCIGGSRTGSGKTLAFALPILHLWSQDPFGIFSLILTPTRELALQITEQFTALGSPQNLKVCLLIGGVDMRAQAVELARRPHIVVATPGRLADHARSSGEDTVCGLRRARILVLDEADRLLTGSFAGDLEVCLGVLPSRRQTLLFTATVTEEVRALKNGCGAAAGDKKDRKGKLPPFVCEIDTLDRVVLPVGLSQWYLLIPTPVREAYLHAFLSTPGNLPKSTIVFTNRAATAGVLAHTLRLLGHRVTALHSELTQRERIDSLGRFRAEAARILVATDVASRGLDIPVVELVVNFDMPRDPDDYVHRIGRTARAGRKGEAIAFVTEHDVLLVEAIEKRIGSKLEKYVEEEGVSLEGRVVRGDLQLVSEKKREAVMNIEEGKNENGKRKRRGMVGLNSRRKKRAVE